MDNFNSWTPDKVAFFNNDDYAPISVRYAEIAPGAITASEESVMSEVVTTELLQEVEVVNG